LRRAAAAGGRATRTGESGSGKKILLEECRPDEARSILDFFEIDRPRLIDSIALAPRALGLALRLEHSVYDCLYMSTAIEVV
jgi:hypothetical protein